MSIAKMVPKCDSKPSVMSLEEIRGYTEDCITFLAHHYGEQFSLEFGHKLAGKLFSQALNSLGEGLAILAESPKKKNPTFRSTKSPNKILKFQQTECFFEEEMPQSEDFLANEDSKLQERPLETQSSEQSCSDEEESFEVSSNPDSKTNSLSYSSKTPTDYELSPKNKKPIDLEEKRSKSFSPISKLKEPKAEKMSSPKKSWAQNRMKWKKRESWKKMSLGLMAKEREKGIWVENNWGKEPIMEKENIGMQSPKFNMTTETSDSNVLLESDTINRLFDNSSAFFDPKTQEHKTPLKNNFKNPKSMKPNKFFSKETPKQESNFNIIFQSQKVPSNLLDNFSFGPRPKTGQCGNFKI